MLTQVPGAHGNRPQRLLGRRHDTALSPTGTVPTVHITSHRVVAVEGQLCIGQPRRQSCLALQTSLLNPQTKWHLLMSSEGSQHTFPLTLRKLTAIRNLPTVSEAVKSRAHVEARPQRPHMLYARMRRKFCVTGYYVQLRLQLLSSLLGLT